MHSCLYCVPEPKDGGEMKHILQRMVSGTYQSDDEFLILLDSLPIPLSWASFPEGLIRFSNSAFIKIFGYPNGHFATIEQWFSEVYVNESESKAACSMWANSLIPGAVGITDIEPHETQIRHANGAVVPVLHRGIVMHEFGLVITMFEDLTNHKLAEHALRRIAYEDALTGLGNRRMLEERWNAELSQRATFTSSKLIAVLMIDLDKFKPINDCFGHAAGDEVLKSAANRLRQSVRSDDTVVRMGGDEFVILLTDLASQADAEKICRRITEAFDEPFVVAGRNVCVGATVGASLYLHHGNDIETLLSAADQALYRMKREGRHNWAWFDQSFKPANEQLSFAPAVMEVRNA